MESDRYSRKRREEMRRRRAEQVKKQRIAAGAVLLFVLLVVIAVIARVVIKGKEKEQRETVTAAVEACYEEFAVSKEEAVPAAKTGQEAKEFAEWLADTYPKQIRGDLLEKAEKGTLTEKDIYDATGETFQVLTDRRKGWLDDEKTAKEHQIYLRDGKEENQAEVTVAGDICFAEDGFVLDHYDETEGLSECISPEILEMTNQADVFYLNHEYCVSERGEALEGKLYTFRAKPERMALLDEMGTDLVSLARR